MWRPIDGAYLSPLHLADWTEKTMHQESCHYTVVEVESRRQAVTEWKDCCVPLVASFGGGMSSLRMSEYS